MKQHLVLCTYQIIIIPYNDIVKISRTLYLQYLVDVIIGIKKGDSTAPSSGADLEASLDSLVTMNDLSNSNAPVSLGVRIPWRRNIFDRLDPGKPGPKGTYVHICIHHHVCS